MRKKTDKEQLLDIVGMYYDIKIIKNNSSKVPDSIYGFFSEDLVNLAKLGTYFNIVMSTKYQNLEVK